MSIPRKFLFLLLLQRSYATQSQQESRHIDPPRAVAMTSDSDRMGDACLRVFGLMEAGDFFQKLRQIKTADGRPRFRKDNLGVTTFPTSLDITVILHAIRCDGDIRRPVILALDSSVVSTFRLKAEWKTPDGALRPGHLEFSEPLLTITTQQEIVWQFKGKVDSEKVDLADRLVLSLSSEKGQRIARISGGVTDRSRFRVY